MKPPQLVDAIYTSGSIGSSDTSTISGKQDRVLLVTLTALMAVQLGLSHATHRGLGLRHDEEERRHEERRAHPRVARDRRRAERRRARLRSLVFTGLAL